MKKLQRQCGFSLTEMLVAVAILLVLMGALLAFGTHLRRQGQEKLCRSTIGVLVAAIEQYHDFHDAFPSSAGSLYSQLYSLPQSRALCDQISKSLIVNGRFHDPWGRPLRYYWAGKTFPEIVSDGPDKQAGTGDDISSK